MKNSTQAKSSIKVIESIVNGCDERILMLEGYENVNGTPAGEKFTHLVLVQGQDERIVVQDANPGLLQAVLELPQQPSTQQAQRFAETSRAVCASIIDLTYLAEKSLGDVPVELSPFSATLLDATMRQWGLECGEIPDREGGSKRRATYRYKREL